MQYWLFLAGAIVLEVAGTTSMKLSDGFTKLMPIILGNGIKLFGNLPSPMNIKKENQKPHESDMVQIEYTIKNA